jgi:tocopherol O-methyltransferase
MASRSDSSSVAGHYDRLDRFYRRLWGEHVHHGLWTDPTMTPEAAVRHLVHRVAEDAQLGKGDRVCDVGCGYGAPARLWARDYGAQVTGFTISAAQHAYAEAQAVEGPAPEYRLQDVLENDLPDGAFDAVVAVESLTHIPDQPGVLREAARLLRPGGRLVACVWMADAAPSEWQRRHLLDPIVEEGRLSGLPTAADLHRWTTAAGLTVERLDDVTPLVRHTWTVVLRRFLGALFTDPDVLRTLLDASEAERVFARTLPRIWLAQHLGGLRYGWLVATRERS